ncbi:hypothetical protein PAMP_012477 [Pampus punctatissimus]
MEKVRANQEEGISCRQTEAGQAGAALPLRAATSRSTSPVSCRLGELKLAPESPSSRQAAPLGRAVVVILGGLLTQGPAGAPAGVKIEKIGLQRVTQASKVWGEVPLPEDLEAEKNVQVSQSLLDDDEDFVADEASGDRPSGEDDGSAPWPPVTDNTNSSLCLPSASTAVKSAIFPGDIKIASHVLLTSHHDLHTQIPEEISGRQNPAYRIYTQSLSGSYTEGRALAAAVILAGKQEAAPPCVPAMPQGGCVCQRCEEQCVAVGVWLEDILFVLLD